MAGGELKLEVSIEAARPSIEIMKKWAGHVGAGGLV